MTLNGWVDVSARARIRVTGEDRKRLLHAMTTNHVDALQPGQSCYAFFLNAQGRILADVVIVCADDHLLLDMEAEVRTKIFQHLDRFIIADDATLEDITDQTVEIVTERPPAGYPPAFEMFGLSHLIVPVSQKDQLVSALTGSGIPETTADVLDQWRLSRGIPRYGTDILEINLVQETRLLPLAVHSAKGCYLGQEIVERVRSRGHINKQLVALKIGGNTVPQRGAKLLAGGTEAGEITSAALIESSGVIRALALARLEALKSGPLQVGGAPAEIVE